MSKVFRFKDQYGKFQSVKKSDLRKWVKALKSGEYKQTRSELENVNGFCCLGVACKIFIAPEDQRLRGEPTCSYDFDCGRLEGTLVGSMPEEQPGAPEWLKGINKGFANRLKRKKPQIKGLRIGKDGSLADLNDCGASFEQIAQVITKVAEL